MNADWKVGDRALCVDMRSQTRNTWHPEGMLQEGVVYMVKYVRYEPRAEPNPIGLIVSGPRQFDLFGCEVGWGSHRFRKIVPACDRVATEQKQDAAQ